MDTTPDLKAAAKFLVESNLTSQLSEHNTDYFDLIKSNGVLTKPERSSRYSIQNNQPNLDNQTNSHSSYSSTTIITPQVSRYRRNQYGESIRERNKVHCDMLQWLSARKKEEELRKKKLRCLHSHQYIEKKAIPIKEYELVDNENDINRNIIEDTIIYNNRQVLLRPVSPKKATNNSSKSINSGVLDISRKPIFEKDLNIKENERKILHNQVNIHALDSHQFCQKVKQVEWTEPSVINKINETTASTNIVSNPIYPIPDCVKQVAVVAISEETAQEALNDLNRNFPNIEFHYQQTIDDFNISINSYIIIIGKDTFSLDILLKHRQYVLFLLSTYLSHSQSSSKHPPPPGSQIAENSKSKTVNGFNLIQELANLHSCNIINFPQKSTNTTRIASPFYLSIIDCMWPKLEKSPMNEWCRFILSHFVIVNSSSTWSHYMCHSILTHDSVPGREKDEDDNNDYSLKYKMSFLSAHEEVLKLYTDVCQLDSQNPSIDHKLSADPSISISLTEEDIELAQKYKSFISFSQLVDGLASFFIRHVIYKIPMVFEKFELLKKEKTYFEDI